MGGTLDCVPVLLFFNFWKNRKRFSLFSLFPKCRLRPTAQIKVSYPSLQRVE